jgi:hypothetical protein
MKNEELLAIYLVDAAFSIRALLPFLHAPHAKLNTTPSVLKYKMF